MAKIHPLADVQSSSIGRDTVIWQFSVVLEGAKIGNNCNINCHTFIENDVVIGNNVTVKSGVYLWNGLRLGDNVFVGPCVAFTNDLFPRSKNPDFDLKPTIIEQGASIGANASILAGITIGKYALVGLGSVVTKNVPDHALVYGSPAKIRGWVDEKGQKLHQIDEHTWKSVAGEIYVLTGKDKIEKKVG